MPSVVLLENKLDDFIESYLEQNIKTVDFLTWEAFSDALIQLTQKDNNKVLVENISTKEVLDIANKYRLGFK